MRATTFLLLSSAVCAGCASKDASFGVSDTGSSAEDGDEQPADIATTEDTAVFAEPLWWRLTSRLLISKGEPIPVKSIVSVEMLGEKDEILCQEDLSIELAEPVASPHEAILVWWKLTPVAGSVVCGVYPRPFPESFYLGVGTMHPDIQAALLSLPSINSDAQLNGAYAALENPDDLVVFGAAGTSDDFEGAGEAISKAPLEDGVWRIKPVYRFAY